MPPPESTRPGPPPTTAPITMVSLAEDLRARGVRPGMTLLNHAGLSRVGWITGGTQAVTDALGAAWEEQGQSGGLARGRVGQADARLFRQRPLIDFATRWMQQYRT